MDLIEVFGNSEELEEYPAGAVIMAEGDPGDKLYVVIEGTVTISLEGRQLATINAGEIVGEMALINSESRSATVTAKTDCRLVPIFQTSFEALLRHVPEFSNYVIKVLADRLRGAYDLIKP